MQDPVLVFQTYLDSLVLCAVNDAYKAMVESQPVEPPNSRVISPCEAVTYRDVIDVLMADDATWAPIDRLAQGGYTALILASLWRLAETGAVIAVKDDEEDIPRRYQPKDLLTQMAAVVIPSDPNPDCHPPPSETEEAS